jgi:hypothetical protein
MTPKAIAFAFVAFFALAGAALAQPTDSGAPGAPGGPGGGGRFGVRQACQADIAKLCADQPPGRGQMRQCLMAHSDQVSDACKSAIAQAQQWRRDHPQGGPDGAPQGPPPQN